MKSRSRVSCGGIILGTALLLFSFSLSAATYDDEKLCVVYAKVGGVVADYILPLTFQDLLDLMAGRNQQLAEDFGGKIDKVTDGGDIASMMILDAKSRELLGAAAGATALQLLMNGAATNSEEVEAILRGHCAEVGPKTIIENQQKAEEAMNQNLPSNN